MLTLNYTNANHKDHLSRGGRKEKSVWKKCTDYVVPTESPGCGISSNIQKKKGCQVIEFSYLRTAIIKVLDLQLTLHNLSINVNNNKLQISNFWELAHIFHIEGLPMRHAENIRLLRQAQCCPSWNGEKALCSNVQPTLSSESTTIYQTVIEFVKWIIFL